MPETGTAVGYDRKELNVDRIPELVGEVESAEEKFIEHFATTDARVAGYDEHVEVELTFEGFQTLDAAIQRVGEVSKELHPLTPVSDIEAGYSTCEENLPKGHVTFKHDR